MDSKPAKAEEPECANIKPAELSSEAMVSQIHNAIALCVGVLLSVLAYSLYPQSRLLVVAVSVFAAIFILMLIYWFVGMVVKSYSGTKNRQPVRYK